MSSDNFFTFLPVASNEANVAVHLFWGEELLAQLAQYLTTTSSQGSAHYFAFYRESLLAFTPLIAYLKAGEGLGIYLDFTRPEGHFKLELQANGKLRALMFAKVQDQFVGPYQGRLRMMKSMPHQRMPYSSHLDFSHASLADITNIILEQSYQLPAMVAISPIYQRSILIHQMPTDDVNSALASYWAHHQERFSNYLTSSCIQVSELVGAMSLSGLGRPQSRRLEFVCNCSKQRMIQNLRALPTTEIATLLAQQGVIETCCDYCQKTYKITEQDLPLDC